MLFGGGTRTVYSPPDISHWILNLDTDIYISQISIYTISVGLARCARSPINEPQLSVNFSYLKGSWSQAFWISEGLLYISKGVLSLQLNITWIAHCVPNKDHIPICILIFVTKILQTPVCKMTSSTPPLNWNDLTTSMIISPLPQDLNAKVTTSKETLPHLPQLKR